MIIEPKIRGFICTTAHPAGCFEHVKNQIDYIKNQPKFETPKNILIIGCSTGYGLASRITTAFSSNKASTIGIMFEKPAKTQKRTATAGWYCTAAFEEFAQKENIYSKTLNADAFSTETIEKTIKLIKTDLKQIDLIIYSLAAPRRTMPDSTIVSSTLKTTDKPFTNKTLNLKTMKIEQTKIEPATNNEIENTVKVMGGQNWFEWIEKLKKADAIAENALTIAYSYIGPELTFPIYRNGTIGMAKKHLYKTAKEIEQKLKVKSLISINKALVTQASAAIPIVPLYLTILYKIMKEKNLHEGCIEQMCRLFSKKIDFSSNRIETDPNGYIRLDDYELKQEIQTEVDKAWQKINDENLKNLADIKGFEKEFNAMFGFGFENIDYNKDVDPQVEIKSINKTN